MNEERKTMAVVRTCNSPFQRERKKERKKKERRINANEYA